MEKVARFCWGRLWAVERGETVAMHPLGGILATWAAGLTEPALKAPTLVELREMDGEKGHFVFFFNHGEKAAEVEFTEELGRSAANVQEIVIGETRKVGEKDLQ
jgi:hypothetical protein